MHWYATQRTATSLKSHVAAGEAIAHNINCRGNFSIILKPDISNFCKTRYKYFEISFIVKCFGMYVHASMRMCTSPHVHTHIHGSYSYGLYSHDLYSYG